VAVEHCFILHPARVLLPSNGRIRERESRDSGRTMFFHLLSIAILAGLAGLVAYELVTEARSAGHDLQDRYHD
jgi:hypothetical protein